MVKAQEKQSRDIWDKVSTIAGSVAALAAVLVPVAVIVVGNWYTAALKERELEINIETSNREWVRVGLDILRDPSVAPNIQKWGLTLVRKYGKIEIEEEVETALLKGAVLPQPTLQEGAAAMPYFRLSSATARVKKIDELQERGISALLKHDFKGALAAYDEAYSVWPTFRNVDEIRRAIIDASKLPDDPNWQALYLKIRDMDLRGTSQDLRERLAAESSR
jgi:hypothetical protein